MYELNGTEHSLEELQGAAKKYGMEFDSYLETMKKKGLVEKTNDAAVDANVASTDTDLASESISSALPKVDDDPYALQEIKPGEPGYVDKSSLKEKVIIGAYAFSEALGGISDYANSISTNVEVFAQEAFGDELTGAEKKAIQLRNKMNSPSMTFDRISSALEKHIDRGDGSITSDIANGNIKSAADKTVDGAIESIPSLVAARLGPWGMVALGVSTAGNKFEEELFADDENKNTGLLLLNATVSGGIEAGFEIATRGLLKKAGFINDQFGAKQAKEFLKEGVVGFAKKIGGGLLGEGFSESATELVSTYWDKLSLGKEVSGDELVERLGDAFVVGSAVGGGISTAGGLNKMRPSQKERVYNTLMSGGDRSALSSIAKEANELQETFENGNEKTKPLIEEKMEILTSQANRIKGNNKLMIDNMSDADLDLYVEKIDAQEKLRRDYSKAKTDGDKKLIDEKYKAINEEAEAIRTIAEKTILENYAGNVKDYSDDIGATFERFTDVEAFQKRYEELSGKTENVRDADGLFEGGVMLMNDVVAGKKGGAVSVASHEFLHNIIGSTFDKLTTKQKVNLNKSFFKILNSDQQAAVKNRLKNSYNISGEGIFETEEMFTAFSDAIAKNEISFNESLFNKAQNVTEEVLRLLGKRSEFQNGRQVYNFLKDYNKTIKKGQRSKRVTEFAKQDKIKVGDITVDTKKSSTVNLDKGEGDVSQRIDAYTESAKTKAEFQSGAFGNIYQGIIDGKFDRVLGEGLSSEQREIMREELADRLINYDPAKTPNLSKWMYGGKGKGGNIGFSALVAKKKLFEKGERRKSEVEGDAPSGTGQTVLEKAAETVTVKDADIELDAEQEYSQFRQDLGLDDSMMQKVRDAVIKTFGTRLPDVSSKKFRATLEKAYRTELKKPIQDMIGSRDAFNEFLGKDYKTVFGKLPVETLIQMERNVDPEQRIFTTSRRITKPTEVDELVAKGKLPKDVNRLSGPLLITKLPYPGIKKVMAFYRGENMSEVLGYEIGASTLGTRKDKLAMEMGVELGFDATAETIQNPEVAERRADIADLQGREQAENEISIIAKQINRDPNVKFSVTSDQFSDQAMSLVNDMIDNGVESVFDPESGKIADGYEDIDKKVASFVFDNIVSLIESKESFRFKTGIAKSKLVPDFIKKLYKDDGNLRKNKKAKGKKKGSLDKLHDDSSVIAKLLGPEIMDAIGYEILGYKNRIMNAAKATIDKKATEQQLENWKEAVKAWEKNGKEGKKPEKPKQVYQKDKDGRVVGGEFYDRLQKLIKDVKKTKGQALPAGLNLDAISMMNKNAGVTSVFGKVEKILFEETTREKKLEKLAKLAPEIEAANEANILLAKHVAKVIINAARSGAISKVSALHIMQSQTGIVFGFRGLSRLDLITVLDGSQKPGESHPQFNEIVKELSKTMSKDDAIAGAKKLTGTKGEHLAPNSNTMLKIAELFFTSDTNAELDAKLDKVFEGHSQMHTTKHLTNVMDKKGGANNDTDFNRVKFLSKKDIDATVSADGRSYLQVLADVEIKKELSKFVNDAKAKVEENAGVDNAKKFSRTVNESRGITVLDFDDTLATSKSNVLYTTPDGKKGKLTAEQFAKQGADLLAQGYVYDFSEFSKVVRGKTAPLFNKAMKLQGKFGPENMFVLTARPADAAPAIFAFLKANGLNIPIKNITGLANSTADAKAFWMAEKVGEGYNDFYFADDALQNVKAVKEVLEQFDVKSKVQQAKVKFSKTMDRDFNSMLERTRGIGASKVFSRIAGEKRGKNVGKFQFFVPPSADDFAGLLRYFAGKGKQGDADIAFFKKALLDPFARADREMSMARQTILNDFKALRKKFPDVKKRLGKLMPNSDFTLDNAIRVYLWNKAGFEIPGLSKRDIENLVARVEVDPITKAFADTLGAISKQQEGYIKPGEHWNVETIAYDLQNITSKIGRKKYLEEFIENKNIIFTKENLNKIEAAYGSNFREALVDVLSRMETGTNRSQKMGRIEGKWNNWVNNSVGAIMFFNARSAVLQTLSTVNFINFENNNVFAAAKAFANQKQYWSDFSMLFNSDFLKQRRAGLATNVNEAELASAVAGAQNKAKAALQYLLKIGFTPTQIADSFAIASGGSTYYRNQVKFYLKDGMDQKAAEEQAFLDFQEIAEETQQSARPDRISQQQASSLGRIVLAFANTPMQYNRLIKKAAGDLINKRGDWRSHVSRIIYYGAVQNFIFSALQSAIFALAFDDEDDEEQLDKKTDRLLNGMLDSLLRGSGLAGAVVSTIKNTALRFAAEDKKGFRADYGNVIVDAVNLSPPIGSKIRKLYSATKTYKFNKEEIMEGDKLDLENPLWDAVGSVVSATTNVPLDRAFRKIDNMKESLNSDNENWQRIAVGLGWDQWSLGIKKPSKSSRKSSRGSGRGGSGRGGSGRGN